MFALHLQIGLWLVGIRLSRHYQGVYLFSFDGVDKEWARDRTPQLLPEKDGSKI